MQQAIIADPILDELERIVADNKLPALVMEKGNDPSAVMNMVSDALIHMHNCADRGVIPDPAMQQVIEHEVPILVAVARLQHTVEEEAKVWQALALCVLYRSMRWEPYAPPGPFGPSFKGFLEKYLPDMKYATAQNHIRAAEFWLIERGMTIPQVQKIGLSKLQTIVTPARREIAETGDLSPATQELIETGSHQDFLTYAATSRDEHPIGFRYTPATGQLTVYIEGLPYLMGVVSSVPGHNDGEGSGPTDEQWQEAVREFEKRLRCSVEE